MADDDSDFCMRDFENCVIYRQRIEDYIKYFKKPEKENDKRRI